MKDKQWVISVDQFYSIIYLFYNDPIREHLSADKMLGKLKSCYYWPEMIKDIKAYI